MIQEERQLLLKDLCARLPYGVKVHLVYDEDTEDIREIGLGSLHDIIFDNAEGKPYLRPMSSMTEEEKDNLQSLHDIISDENYGDGYSPGAWSAITEWEDYCNARHLDYRGLIPMGLALEAPEGMYKTE